jgi:hypothetical protein
MTEKNEQPEARLASDLNRELDDSKVLALNFFDKGCLAFKSGMRIDECPYLRNSEASNIWRFGYALESSMQQIK